MSQVATSPVTPTRLSGTAFTVSCGASESALSTGGSGVELHLALPHLSGPGSHFLAAGEAEEKDGVQLFTSPGQVAGVVVIPCEHNLRSAVRDAYARILNATQGLHLWRMWNTVPDINCTREGLENYRAFNAGRFDAVTAHLGL